MNIAKVHSFIKQLNQLPKVERSYIISALIKQNSNQSSLKDAFISEHCSKVSESCPHCHQNNVTKYGKTKSGEQRYFCKDCHKTFVATINSIFYKSQKNMVVWEKFISCMVDKFSISKAAEICEISTHTAFTWRHKILDAIIAYTKEPKLKNIIEADETFFKLSFKGTRKLPKGYYPKRRGSSYKKTPAYLKRKLVCVLCAVDNQKNALSKVAGIGGISINALHNIFDGSIVRGSTLISDGWKAYTAYCENNYGYIKHVKIEADVKVWDGYHINHVNAYHSALKGFLYGFKGVSTKYLSNYLAWFNVGYAVKDMEDRKDNIVKPVIMSSFTENWSEVSLRSEMPILEAA